MPPTPPRLSTRISFRWQHEEPSEPTTTIVLSVGGYFIDLRVRNDDAAVDWAFAGTREILGTEPLHCRWNHVIDSRNAFAPDEGRFHKLPNGDDLETGCMPCPTRNNAPTPYEEVWRALPLPPDLESAWILQRPGKVDDSHTDQQIPVAFLGRVGAVFLAMAQDPTSGEFTVVREDLAQMAATEAPWTITFRSGTATLPSLARLSQPAFPGETAWQVGDVVHIQDLPYVVRAKYP